MQNRNWYSYTRYFLHTKHKRNMNLAGAYIHLIPLSPLHTKKYKLFKLPTNVLKSRTQPEGGAHPAP